MTRMRYNGLRASLGGALTNSGTTITFAATLKHSGGTNVPTLAAGEYLPLCILDANGNLAEIVRLTAYTAAGTTGTITRGQESTTGVAHSTGRAVVGAPLLLDETNDWQTPSFGTGWANWSDTTNMLVRCVKIGTLVTVQGLCRRTSGAGAAILQMPAGYFPSRSEWDVAIVNLATFATVQMTTAGVLNLGGTYTNNQALSFKLSYYTDAP